MSRAIYIAESALAFLGSKNKRFLYMECRIREMYFRFPLVFTFHYCGVSVVCGFLDGIEEQETSVN